MKSESSTSLGRWTASLAAAALLGAGCFGPSLAGKIRDGFYIAPEERFACPLPFKETRIVDGPKGVEFSSPAATYRVYREPWSPEGEFGQMMAEEGRKVALGYLAGQWFPQGPLRLSGARPERQEFFTDIHDGALFTIYSLPYADPLFKTSSLRIGTLFFFKGDSLFVVRTDLDPGLSAFDVPSRATRERAMLRRETMAFAQSLVFAKTAE